MLCGSRAWCMESMRTSGSGSSTPGVSLTLTLQMPRPWRLVPREVRGPTIAGYAAWIWSSTEVTSSHV